MPPSTTSTRPPRFLGVQALRFIAAFMVVLTHTTFMIGERFHGIGDQGAWREGNAGVDIFFVISGFVMAISSAPLRDHPHAAREFTIRRLMRIVPLYWVATTLKLVAVLLIPAMTLHSVFNPSHVVASYLFLPWHNAEGEIKPLVGVGWTLTFEMFFYALFAASLACRRDPLRFTLPILAILAFLSFFKDESGGAWQVYLDPILLEFGLGVVAARIITRGFNVDPRIGLVVVGIGFACFFIPSSLFGSQRALGWGVPAFFIVLCTAGMEPYLSKVLPRSVDFWGDSSYALYLFHSFYVPVVGAVLVKLGMAHAWIGFLASVIGSIILGAVVHRWVEKPLGAVLKATRQRSARTQLAAIRR